MLPPPKLPTAELVTSMDICTMDVVQLLQRRKRLRRGIDCHAVRLELERLLHDRFQLEHTTLQVDHVRESPLVELRRLSDSGR